MTLGCSLFYIGAGAMPDMLLEPLNRHLSITDQHFDLARFITEEEFQNGVWHSNEFAMVTLGRPLLKGEVGCALAHQHAYRMASDGTNEWSLVIEDDVTWSGEIEGILDRLINELPKFAGGPAVVLLGWNKRSVGPVVGGPHLMRILGIPTGAFAYLINRPAAKLLSQTQKIEHVADWPINASGIRFLRTANPIFVHEPKRNSLIDTISPMPRTEADRGRLGVFGRIKLLKSKAKILAFTNFVVIRAAALLFEKLHSTFKICS